MKAEEMGRAGAGLTTMAYEKKIKEMLAEIDELVEVMKTLLIYVGDLKNPSWDLARDLIGKHRSK